MKIHGLELPVLNRYRNRNLGNGKNRKSTTGVVEDVFCPGEQMVEKLKCIGFTAIVLQTGEHILLGFREVSKITKLHYFQKKDLLNFESKLK